MKKVMAYVVTVLSCTALFSFSCMALSEDYTQIQWEVINAYGYSKAYVYNENSGAYTNEYSTLTYGGENQWVINMNRSEAIEMNRFDGFMPIQTPFTLVPDMTYRVIFDIEIWDWIKYDTLVYMGFSDNLDYKQKAGKCLTEVTVNREGHTYNVEFSFSPPQTITANYMFLRFVFPSSVSFSTFYVSVDNAYIAAFDSTGKQVVDAINNAVNEDFGYTKPDSPNTDEGLQAGNDLLDDMEGNIDDFCENIDSDTSSVIENVNQIGPVMSGVFGAIPAPVTVAMSGSVVLLVIRKVVGR